MGDTANDFVEIARMLLAVVDVKAKPDHVSNLLGEHTSCFTKDGDDVLNSLACVFAGHGAGWIGDVAIELGSVVGCGREEPNTRIVRGDKAVDEVTSVEHGGGNSDRKSTRLNSSH